MDHRSALDALIDAFVDIVIDGLAEATASHQTAREQGAALRAGEAARALFGARLDDTLTALLEEVTHRAASRVGQIRRHPRYSKDPLANELDDAEATLGREIVAAQDRSVVTPALPLALALLRAEAVAIAAGDKPIAGHKTPRSATGGPKPRRRDITAADVPPEVAQAIFEAARGTDIATVVAGLRDFESTPVNAGAIVTKLRVLLERDGVGRARKLASALRDAGMVELVATPESDTGPDAAIGTASRPIAATPRKPSTPGGTPRPSMRERIQARQNELPTRNRRGDQ